MSLLFSIATARWLIAPPFGATPSPELLHRHGIDVTVDDFAQFEHLSLEDECQAYHDTWGIGANGEELYRELGEILIDGYSKVPPRKGLLAFLEQAKAAALPCAWLRPRRLSWCSPRSLVPGSTLTWSLLPRR